MSFQLSPNVDRNKMFLIQRRELEGVWNAEFYSPFFLENRSKLKNNPYGLIKLGNITSKITKGETPLWKRDSYQDEGVLFIKSENILENQLDISSHNRISNLVHTRMGRSQLQKNDVLFNIVGASIGRACVYPLNEKANINQAVCLIRINKDFYPDWLAITLNSRPYQIYINQLKSGGARDNIDLHQVNSFEFPNHPIYVQKQIIAKMDAAYAAKKQKEAEAQRLLDSIDDYLLCELGINLSEPEENTIQNRVFYRKLSEVSGGRFDPNNYQNERLEAINSLKNGIFPVKKSCEIVAFRSIKTNEITEETVYVGMENITSNTGEIVTTNEKDSISSASIFMKNDVLFPKLRPYLNKVYCAEEEGICSTEFHVLHSNSECNEFIANFLRSRVVVSQTKCLTSGNTLPRLQLEDIKKFLIPIPPLEKQLEIVDRITAIRTQAKQLRQAAAAELEQAKQEVEAMILGES